MKKIIGFFLSVLILISIPAGPALAETAGGDNINRMAELVKSKFTIPAEYTVFSGNVYGEGDDLTYRLHWGDDTYYAVQGGSVEVALDAAANIIEYYSYRYTSGEDYRRRLPAISKTRAMEAAQKYLYYLCPDIIDQVDIDTGEKYYSLEYDGSYRFYFARQYKGVPYYDNYVTFQIKGDTGELGSYSRNWTKGLKFPEPDQAVKEEQAKEYYKERAGLALTYRRTYGKDEDKAYLQYSPKTSEEDAGINALTGEKVLGTSAYNPFISMGNNDDSYLRDSIMNKGETGLSESEVKALSGTEKLITAEEGEKLAGGLEGLGIDSSCKLTGYNYGKRASDGIYTLRLDFSRQLPPDDSGKNIPDEKLKAMMAAGAVNETLSITFNARTSELITFTTYSYGSSTGEQQSSAYETAVKAAEGFLKKYKADKWDRVERIQDRGDSNKFMEKYGIWGPNAYDNIIFLRKENGIIYRDNWIAFNFNPQTGKFTYYTENWDDLALPSPDSAIGLDKAYEVLFRDVGLELKYILGSAPADSKDLKTDYSNPLLVFSPAVGKPVCIDAGKGIVINSFNGEPYRDATQSKYTDIENHSAGEKITALADVGIKFDVDSFRPDDVILQKDFLFLLGKMNGNIVSNSGTNGLTQRELDGMYRTMINGDVLEEDEKDPDGKVTRIEGIKYLLNALGYKKFAELKGIFRTDFVDESGIDKADTGYAAIAKALNLVSGETLEPDKELTRAQAAELIYNWLIRP